VSLLIVLAAVQVSQIECWTRSQPWSAQYPRWASAPWVLHSRHINQLLWKENNWVFNLQRAALQRQCCLAPYLWSVWILQPRRRLHFWLSDNGARGIHFDRVIEDTRSFPASHFDIVPCNLMHGTSIYPGPDVGRSRSARHISGGSIRGWLGPWVCVRGHAFVFQHLFIFYNHYSMFSV